jgi:hypothetical protein
MKGQQFYRARLGYGSKRPRVIIDEFKVISLEDGIMVGLFKNGQWVERYCFQTADKLSAVRLSPTIDGAITLAIEAKEACYDMLQKEMTECRDDIGVLRGYLLTLPGAAIQKSDRADGLAH